MPTEINCDCGKSYMVPDGREGKSFNCKDCGVTLTIPRKRTAREPQENRKRTVEFRLHNGTYIFVWAAGFIAITFCAIVIGFKLMTDEQVLSEYKEELTSNGRFIFGCAAMFFGPFFMGLVLWKRLVILVDFGSNIRVLSLRGNEYFRWKDLKLLELQNEEAGNAYGDSWKTKRSELKILFRGGRELHLAITKKEIQSLRKVAGKHGKTVKDTREIR